MAERRGADGAQQDEIVPKYETVTAGDQKGIVPQDEKVSPAAQSKKARKKARREAAAAAEAQRAAPGQQSKKERKRARKAAAALEREKNGQYQNGVAAARPGEVLPQYEKSDPGRMKRVHQQDVAAATRRAEESNALEARAVGYQPSRRSGLHSGRDVIMLWKTCWLITRFVQFGLAASILGIVAYTTKLVLSNGWQVFAWEIVALLAASLTIIGIAYVVVSKLYVNAIYNYWIFLVLDTILFILWAVSAALAGSFENSCGSYCDFTGAYRYRGGGSRGPRGLEKRLPTQNSVRNWWAQAATGLCILEMLFMLFTLLPLAYMILMVHGKISRRNSPFRENYLNGRIYRQQRESETAGDGQV